MGRKRQHHKHLPKRMRHKHGAYYHVTSAGGKQHWINLGTDYGDALRQWAQLEGQATLPILTVADALAAYLADRQTSLAQKTIAGYRAQAQTLGKVFGPMRLADVTRAHVYTYLKKRGNVAGNRERDLLRAAYNHAANIGYNGPNPAEGMRYRNTETPRQRYVTDEELAALVLAAKPRLANLILFLYLTGISISDALALPITAADETGIRWTRTKTKHPMLVEWSPELRAVWKAATGQRIGNQPVFLGQRGPYTLHGLESTW
ncbi:MAG: hypothetical protein L0H83_14530, partial [Salinisphaera sp.]|nr:hypothetical protein [Salinisphaera sp.]